MDSPTVNKIIETEAQAAQIINDAETAALQIAEQAKLDSEKLLADCRKKALIDGDEICKKAEEDGKKKAAKINSDYDKKVADLNRRADANKAKAIQTAINSVLSF